MPSQEEIREDEPGNDVTALVEWINNQGDAGEVNEILERANSASKVER